MVVGGTPTTANKSSYNKIIAVVGVFTDDKVPMSSTVILNIKVDKEVKVSQTYLVDAKGNVVFQSTETSNTQKIDVSKFAKGIYYLAIVTDKGMQGKKIVIE